MADWYVFRHDGHPLGPWPTEVIAESILQGVLPADVWVGAPGGPRWLRALDVPVIARLIDGIPTKPRRDSGLRIVPGYPEPESAGPVFATTLMMVKDYEVETLENSAVVEEARRQSMRDAIESARAALGATDA